MGEVLLGTCSWTDKELIASGKFYPAANLSAEDRLRYYASRFPLVEVDSSYYALPNPYVSSLWAERTPADFVFDVKAFRLFTGHWAEKSAFPRDLQEELGPQPEGKRGFYYKDVPSDVADETWRRFREALAPLHDSGKLGLVLFQYPAWVRPSTSAKDQILEARERMVGHDLAIEFRHRSWVDEKHRADTLRFLRDNDLAFVCVDEPQGFASSLPPLAEATADTAYVRFHGRNAATWEARGTSSAERFDWYYKPEEMGEWVPRIRALEEQTKAVHALMNTNRGDQGPANARLLARLLQIPLPEEAPKP
ncbi:MAG: DUF72 domain-containing protein [Dehalococcoidales bacterium]|nr:DUF72 domain-containing protein [Dehalococcoidales bacterium]